MAAPAWRPAPNRIQLSVTEARTRFLQLIRLTPVTGQETIILDQGRPVAAIVPPDVITDRRGDQPDTASAAGWLQRLENVRSELQRQHTAHASQLRQALNEAWSVI